MMTASEIAASVRSGRLTAVDATEAALARIAEHNARLGAFTDVTADRARSQAARVDQTRAAGRDPGPLAGVPFAVKNLFDVTGLPTRAGSKINRGHPPATRDATLITRLEAAGAVLTGSLNMGEYAYDFTGENAHDGPSRNPHDPLRMTGGSSGGSGAAVASGMVPLTLGSDTNGSIRVPSSHCGLFGLKPTYGRLSRARSFPFVASLDHLGPFARCTADLALAYDAMLGADPDDPAQADAPPQPITPTLAQGLAGLRIARAGGYFAAMQMPEATVALDLVASALGAGAITLEGVAEARAAAYLITMAEGAALHLDRLQTVPEDFDPDVRDRLIAGAMIPAAWVVKAQKYRRIFRAKVLAAFAEVDVILAPSAPCSAPLIGQRTFVLDGQELAVRPNMGIFTQPISFIGLPVVSVPVWPQGHAMPVGVQIICAPWREDIAVRVAQALEAAGVVRAPVAAGYRENG